MQTKSERGIMYKRITKKKTTTNYDTVKAMCMKITTITTGKNEKKGQKEHPSHSYVHTFL